MSLNISFWLIPTESDRLFFQEIINRLAERYHAPKFTPHVTIYSGRFASETAIAPLLKTSTQNISPFSLTVDRILHSEQFTKTLFVQFQANETLSQLSAKFQHQALAPQDYSLNPHLSLMYQVLDPVEKQQLAEQIKVPSLEISFDEVRAIATPGSTQTKADVESWQEIASIKLQAYRPV